ncbi:hypothetical protein BaRGS_00035067 [Batillaria attramentaria]|uniref:SH3 domain-containing protein n=1 Tax=Batillaria attramentaria TaxID=370345 RepID=A0ABD0JFL8_9CAEN
MFADNLSRRPASRILHLYCVATPQAGGQVHVHYISPSVPGHSVPDWVKGCEDSKTDGEDLITRPVNTARVPLVDLEQLPNGGADLTLSELQGLAARQQVAMETQQQALVARETRLKYLQQQEARHRQLASEQARLQKMRERVEAQELKLKKLRALRGQVDQYKASNGNLNSELETVRALFNEKEKELALAVSKVDQLMRQLQELRDSKGKGAITNGNSAKADTAAVTMELEKLRSELLHRNQVNEQQNSRLAAQRQLLQQKKGEVAKMDARILELQQRLKNAKTNSVGDQNQVSARIQGRKPGQNIAAVEPYIQYAPKDVAKDDLYSKQGFLKQDPKYQSLPPNTKVIPTGKEEEGLKSSVVGSRPAVDNQSSQGRPGTAGVGSAPGPRPFPGQSTTSVQGTKVSTSVTAGQGTSTTSSSSQLPTNSVSSVGPRPFVSTYGKPGLGIWPPAPKDSQPQQQQQPHISIFEEERQAGSGQSSPASSEGSGPLVKPVVEPPPPSGLVNLTGQGLPPEKALSKPAEFRDINIGRHPAPKPPPRAPQVQPPPAPSDQAGGHPATAESSRLGAGRDEPDSSRANSSTLSPGLPLATSTPLAQSGVSGGQPVQSDGGKPAASSGSAGIHLNQRPAPTYRYASKSVIANTYMGRLGNAALEKYQQNLNKLYKNLDKDSPVEQRTAFGSQQPAADVSLTGDGAGGMTHFGLVGSPNYPDIASDKGSYKSNTPKHIRRRHSDSDNEDLNKLLHRGDKHPSTPNLENVAEDKIGNQGDVQNGGQDRVGVATNSASQRLGNNSTAENGNTKEPPSSPSKSRQQPGHDGKAVVVRRKKTILKGEKSRKSMNRVSFDPLALLLDASLEGELELVKKSAAEVEDVSAPNDEGITALHNAICAGHYDIVKFLIEFGADVNSPDSDGWTPLHCAASCNNLLMVRFLVEHGACIFATTISDNETAAEKCEEDEDGYDGCSDYLYSIQEKLGIMNNGEVYAVFSYVAHNEDELSFQIGDKMMVLRKGDDIEKEWWWARHGNQEGYIPRNLLGLYPRVLPPNYHPTSEC